MHFQWLRAAVLGASDDLVSTASLMLGIGAACPADERAVLLSGLAGLVAVAWPSASRPPVRANRPRRRPRAARCLAGRNQARGPTPVSAGLRLQAAAVSPSSQAAATSALSFAAGAMFPLLAAWFVASYASRRLLPPPFRREAARPPRPWDGHRLVLLSPATASGTTSPLPLLLAHNSHMFTGERGILVS
ncbi:hypothetical protein OsJ_22098 [Oryza sativa Japonica Group]|uniref:Vacuolar iron transporter n=1 Tax=Oryza sativa subsp. japonica TaxID=39947 RepID=B9FQ37_ORYSJ|nr:hypothetical protein OsJ_22098 [Oryza sativa Japonica Group]KAF2927734.1 hypothetical protein DAI22_06g227200 [Oryza sativa Japonica Group]